MDGRDSREYSWRWITASRLLSHGPCELVGITQTSADGVSDVTFYDGESTSGDQIFTLEALQNRSCVVNFTTPIYCRRGLYVDFGSNLTGVLVQWRQLPRY